MLPKQRERRLAMRSIGFILAIALIVVVSFLSSDSYAKKPTIAAIVTLSDLSCLADEIAKFDGQVWVCAADNTGLGGGPCFVLRDDNGMQVGTVLSADAIWTAIDIFTLVAVSNSSADKPEVLLVAYPGELWGGAPLYFDNIDCTGISILRTDRGFLPALSPYAVVRSDGVNLNLWIPASYVYSRWKQNPVNSGMAIVQIARI